ncbi:BMP family ABC transporter substrate-binding protein [Alicyclobacillus tolerans]|uniref:BMP family ABC transporter substrate-binding protein n=1 Tax=Alicyclobacillus tolerans TaxID=90970 RepID=UPI003B7C5A25
MNQHWIRYFAVTAVTLLAVSGCSVPRQHQRNGTNTEVKATGARALPFETVLVTNRQGMNDLGANDGAWNGLVKSHEMADTQPGVVQSHTVADEMSNLEQLGEQHVQFIVASSGVRESAVRAAAKKYPLTHFLLLGQATTGQANVAGAVFDTQQAAYAMGYLAGLADKSKNMNKPQKVAVLYNSQSAQELANAHAFAKGFSQAYPGQKPMLMRLPTPFASMSIQSAIHNATEKGAFLIYGAGNVETGPLLQAAETSSLQIMNTGYDAASRFPQHVLASLVPQYNLAVENAVSEVDHNQFKSNTATYNLQNHGVVVSVSHDCPMEWSIAEDRVLQSFGTTSVRHT